MSLHEKVTKQHWEFSNRDLNAKTVIKLKFFRVGGKKEREREIRLGFGSHFNGGPLRKWDIALYTQNSTVSAVNKKKV